MSRLEPLFYEVYQKAKMQEPLISDSVRLYMNDDESENAFATGKMCIRDRSKTVYEEDEFDSLPPKLSYNRGL